MLQIAPRSGGKADSITIEVHYHYHANCADEAGLNQMHESSSELHSVFLSKSCGGLLVRDGPSHIRVVTELPGDTGRQCLDKTA